MCESVSRKPQSIFQSFKAIKNPTTKPKKKKLFQLCVGIFCVSLIIIIICHKLLCRVFEITSETDVCFLYSQNRPSSTPCIIYYYFFCIHFSGYMNIHIQYYIRYLCFVL